MSTVSSGLRSMLEGMLHPNDAKDPPTHSQFLPTKELMEKDAIIVDMLNSRGHEAVSYCVSDPVLDDCPIVFSSDGFCTFTGYSREEIQGRNCRFLQGAQTSKDDVDRIRRAIAEQHEASVNLLNYRKDGTTFCNEFFLSPLHDTDGKVAYFIGIQTQVPKLGPGQAPTNPGWVYTQGLHA